MQHGAGRERGRDEGLNDSIRVSVTSVLARDDAFARTHGHDFDRESTGRRKVEVEDAGDRRRQARGREGEFPVRARKDRRATDKGECRVTLDAVGAECGLQSCEGRGEGTTRGGGRPSELISVSEFDE